MSFTDFIIDYISDLFNEIYRLNKENKILKKKISFNERTRRKMQKSLMEQIEKLNNTIIELEKERIERR